ncbi:ATP synthase subunit delta, mitochondrial-like [Apostichopus japonicus]|uniref:ATP synthase subunit delta, mitochondrial-like n=1 Tax=Stichopus japonicus TaxID=307972 RepID=UPI003AB349C2
MALVRNLTKFSSTLRGFRGATGTCQHVRYYAEEAAATSPNQMSFSFGIPGQMYYNQASVKQVDVPSTSGTFGILAQHVPLLAALKPGVITVTEDDGTINKYFASSGTVTVNADSSVQVLSEIAVPLDYLDPDAIKRGLSQAQQELQAASTDEARAEAQIAVEVHEAMDAAVTGK